MSTYTFHSSIFDEDFEFELRTRAKADAEAEADTDAEELYLTPRQYAEVTGQHPASVRRKVRKGTLSGKREDGRWYVRASRYLFDKWKAGVESITPEEFAAARAAS